MSEVTLDEREAAFAKVREWLADGHSWIGGFENADLSHRDIGHRILLAYDDVIFEDGVIGKTRAPDGRSHGLGWRYLLELKTRDAAEAVKWLLRDESN